MPSAPGGPGGPASRGPSPRGLGGRRPLTGAARRPARAAAGGPAGAAAEAGREAAAQVSQQDGRGRLGRQADLQPRAQAQRRAGPLRGHRCGEGTRPPASARAVVAGCRVQQARSCVGPARGPTGLPRPPASLPRPGLSKQKTWHKLGRTRGRWGPGEDRRPGAAGTGHEPPGWARVRENGLWGRRGAGQAPCGRTQQPHALVSFPHLERGATPALLLGIKGTWVREPQT